ncbi:Os05g0388850 [Oryza sativa Japonica Group]|uniref:Os05g0388850 protein n=1 Tax=Oryza sativa subsp. japonica TaxID=39947 RepID=A0A0P0WM34_ORYSJ|nr:Os05g0388850 [Oryza sativa Japonica Group]
MSTMDSIFTRKVLTGKRRWQLGNVPKGEHDAKRCRHCRPENIELGFHPQHQLPPNHRQPNAPPDRRPPPARRLTAPSPLCWPTPLRSPSCYSKPPWMALCHPSCATTPWSLGV